MSDQARWHEASIKELGGSNAVQTGPFGAELHAEDYVPTGVPLVLIRNIGDGEVNEQGLPLISETDAKRLSSYALEAGDVVFSRVGRVGSCFLVDERQVGWIISGQLLRVRIADDAIDKRFLLYQLLSEPVQRLIRDKSVGTTRQSINTSILEQLKIRVPHGREQRRIAEVLFTVDAALRSTERIVAKLEHIREGLLDDLLTRGIDVNGVLRDRPRRSEQVEHRWFGPFPSDWRPSLLGELLIGIDAGWSPECVDNPPSGVQWGVLKVSAVSSGAFLASESKTLPAGVAARRELEVQAGDVLCVRANGVAELVGRVAYVETTPPLLMLSDKTLRLRPGQRIDPMFLAATMSGRAVRSQVARVIGGSSGQKNISQTQLRELRVLLPPLAEQRRIVATLSEHKHRIATEQQRLDKLQLVKKALSADLLSGRVRATVDGRKAA